LALCSVALAVEAAVELAGVSARMGEWAAVLAEAMAEPHLAEAEVERSVKAPGPEQSLGVKMDQGQGRA